MIRTRALTDVSGYICDWGDCETPAVLERYSDGHGWLPVCDRHDGRDVWGSFAERKRCQICGRNYAITTKGRLRLHRQGLKGCPGSGRP